MAFYTVKSSQLFATAFLTSVITAGAIIGYSKYEDRKQIPQVHVDRDDKCVKVMNFKNGDAYNCEDVDVVLRQYRITDHKS